jgi:hypothetical protein
MGGEYRFLSPERLRGTAAHWAALAQIGLYSITTNQSAIAALFRVMNRYLGNLPPMLRASRAERRRRARARPDALGHATTTAHRRSFPSAISCFMAGIT